jgi:asparagine synthase (glutamine-hydrolysing)
MSVQFGRWNFDGKPPSPDYLENVRNVLAPYGPDGGSSYSESGVDILYYALHTTKDSRREIQPYVLESGAVITWDGRLDNRMEFIALLKGSLSQDSADVSIVAAAFERWGTDCFARLIGDWALSIWNPKEHAVILAKDFLGARHLSYAMDKDQLTWSTILDPLVLFTARPLTLNEEYIAGWFSFFPATHLTPYIGIYSVPPSSFVHLKPGKRTTHKYWDFDPSKNIRHCTDAEYEEHFRIVFTESVRRRLHADAPVLAELSGGMDSCSIVCMADWLMARGAADALRLDTVSYYNDSERNWDERPYFSRVEEKRGLVGCHIDVSSQQLLGFDYESDRFPATPASEGRATGAAEQFAALLTSEGNRVVLSGMGGDEVTGGVPTPVPELADLLARARIVKLAHQLKVWALDKRKPWFHLLFEIAREFLPIALTSLPKYLRPAPWLEPGFVGRNRAALTGYPSRLKLFASLPSFQANLSTLDVLRRQMAVFALPSEPVYEQRYPYLDRDFLEFIYAIPREQLVRPGQRRSLLGIVPTEILNRKRKAYIARAPLAAVSNEWANLIEISRHMVCASLGILDADAFREALQKARQGHQVQTVTLLRTLRMEQWLRGLRRWRLSTNLGSESPAGPSERGATAVERNECGVQRGLRLSHSISHAYRNQK